MQDLFTKNYETLLEGTHRPVAGLQHVDGPLAFCTLPVCIRFFFFHLVVSLFFLLIFRYSFFIVDINLLSFISVINIFL